MSRMTYTTNFVLSVIANTATIVIELALLYMVINKFGHMRGWTYWEIAFMLCIWKFGWTIINTFFNNLHMLEFFIRRGSLDQILVQPINPLMGIILRRFNFFGLGSIFPNIALLIIVSRNLTILWSPWNVIYFIIVIFSCALIEVAIALAVASISFWVIRGDALAQITMYFQLLMQYPLTIYGKAVQIFMTFIFPYAFMAFYPSHYFLGKESGTLFHPVFCVISPLVGVILLIACLSIWDKGLSKYASVGS